MPMLVSQGSETALRRAGFCRIEAALALNPVCNDDLSPGESKGGCVLEWARQPGPCRSNRVPWRRLIAIKHADSRAS